MPFAGFLGLCRSRECSCGTVSSWWSADITTIPGRWHWLTVRFHLDQTNKLVDRTTNCEGWRLRFRCYSPSAPLSVPHRENLLSGNQILLEILERCAWEGWRRSVGPIVWKMKKYYIESRRRWKSYVQRKWRKANGIGHILRRNCLQKHVIQGKNGERIDVTRRQGKIRKQLPGDIR